MDASREDLEDAIAHLIPDKPFPKHIDETVFLDLQNLLSHHPDKVFSVWAHENPRLFLLLRMLGCDDDALFQRLDSENIGDFWLPLGSATLTQLSSFTDIAAQDWRRAQLHVLSQSDQMSEHKLTSPVHAHRHIRDGAAYFEELEKIGKGGSAEVARVRHKLSAREYACKRIKRAPEVKIQRNQLIEFVAEVSVLKRVSHHHLVSFVASFTDLSSFSLILNPVAKDVLKSVLERQARDQPLPEREIATLRRSFGCLATALAYLHELDVRHKDIKPGNILLSDGRVYLCDFGISRDFSQAEHSTTEDEVLKLTPRYCAPEVFGREPRNKKSDVWSLGCVFLEIISVIKGYPMEELNNFLLEASDHESRRGLCCALDSMTAWLEKIRSEKNDSADDIPLGWIMTMIRSKKDHRISASELVDMITKASGELETPDLYIGACCTRTNSVSPSDVGDSSEQRSPAIRGLGIENAPSSPNAPNLLSLPHRTSNASSRGRSSNASSHRRQYSEDRTCSISPHTRSVGPRDSTETAALDTNSVNFPRRDSSNSKPLQHIASRTDSYWSPSLFSPSRPESEATFSATYRPRSPIPPPAQFEVKCGCAARPEERHILNVPYISTPDTMPFDPSIPTIRTAAKCEVGEDRIQIYETSRTGLDGARTSAIPQLWWSTRRLVISYVSGQPKMRHCSSFWIPLADIECRLVEKTVMIRWSDCNQMVQRVSGNYSTHYDWIYNPSRANNAVTVRFHSPNSAQRFIDTVRLPYEDGETIRNGRRLDVSDNTELNIFDVGRSGVRNYRAATLTFVNSSVATSKLYIQWREADLNIHIRDSFDARSAATPGYEMVVEMRNVAMPTYHSDTRGEPAADEEKVAYFSEARCLKTILAVAFQIGVKHGLPQPPDGVAEMLHALTGWTLRYFAIVTKLKSKTTKRFISKRYGRADVLLWEKEVDDTSTGPGIRRRGAMATFRLHDSSEYLWVSASITAASSISTSSTGHEATVSVSHKAWGQLLDVSKMVAIPGEGQGPEKQSSGKGHRDTREDLSDLVLAFENEHYRLDFVNLVTRFKTVAQTAAPLSRTATGADSMRRINSLASNNVHMSPPMRTFDPMALIIPDMLYDDNMHKVRSNHLSERSSYDERLFYVRWDVVKCMHARYKEDIPSIGSTIVLTGTVLRAQATTCEYYIKQTWPKTGTILVEALDAFIKDQDNAHRRSGKASDHLGNEILVQSITDGAIAVSMIRVDDAFGFEIAQQLAWLGSALSISPFGEQMAYAKSAMSPTDIIREIQFRHETIPVSETACWLALFSGAVIAYGFPIPNRANELGLEISIGLLAGLSGVRHAVEFQGGVLMKGFSNLFVPVRKSDDIIQWHAIYSADPSTHLTYQEGLSQCESRALLEEVSLSDLRTCRHIVGWWSVIQSRLGSDRAIYENIHYSTATDAKPSVKCTNASVGFQQFGMATLDFEFGVTEGKCHFKRDGPYRNIVTWAEKTPIVLYDTAERRGWLVPASEVLLHIIQCRHRQEPFEVNGNRITLDTNVPVYSSAKDILLRNMSTRLSDDREHTFKTEIASIWSLLDFLIADNVAREKHSPGHTIRTTRGEVLHGFEFKAVVEQHSPFRQKQTNILETNGGWPSLLRDIDALVLLANGFEDILVPVMERSRNYLCRSWQYVPKDKDFLATSTRSILKLYERAGCSLDRKFLTSSESKLQWHQGSSLLFDSCTDPSRGPCRCIRLQRILPKSTVTSIVPPEHVVDHGGVIFGHLAATLVKTQRTSRTPRAKVSGIYSQENRQLPVDVSRDDCQEEGSSSSDSHGQESMDTTLDTHSRSPSPATTTPPTSDTTCVPFTPSLRKLQLPLVCHISSADKESDGAGNEDELHLDSRPKKRKAADLQSEDLTSDVDCIKREDMRGPEDGLSSGLFHQPSVPVELTGKNNNSASKSHQPGELAIHTLEPNLSHSLRRQHAFSKNPIL